MFPGRVALAISTTLIAGLLITPGAAADDAAEDNPVPPPDKRITFLAELPHRSQALALAARAVSTPGSEKFRQYRSVAEAARDFGATDAQIARLKKRAAALGLSVAVDPTRLVARITGTVKDWEAAMGTQISYAPSAPGSPTEAFIFPVEPDDEEPPAVGSPTLWPEYYVDLGLATMGAPKGLEGAVTRMAASYLEYNAVDDVKLPDPLGLEDDLEQVGGWIGRILDDRPTAPQGVTMTASRGERERALYFPGSEKQAPPTNPASDMMRNCLNDPTSALAQRMDEVGLAPSNFVGQNQVFDAYGLTGLQARSGSAAKNRVAILSLGGGFSEDDLRAAAECSGFTKPEVRITRGTGVPTPFVGVDDETTLDVQTVSATLSRASSIQMVQVNQNVGGADLVDAYSRALALTPQPYSVTLSYGYCEPLVAGQNLFPTVDSLMRFAAVIGTTVSVSAGDGGASSCQAQFGGTYAKVLLIEQEIKELQATGDTEFLDYLEELLPLLKEQAAALQPISAWSRTTVVYPGSSPEAMSVGGTQIVMNADGTRSGEAVWNDVQYQGADGGNIAGTGGPSSAYDAPAYQQPLTRSNVRMVPDISAMSGPYPGLPIVLDGMVIPMGGTSQAAPMMAAAMALLSAEEVKAGRPTLGMPNPWLYDVARRAPRTMYDVTIGENQYPIVFALDGSVNIPSCCQADLGYDATTGLGVPQFNVLAQHVQVR